MIAIIDYGVGNLFSLAASFAKIGVETVVTGDPSVIASADRLILPGVGAYGDAAAKLRESALAELIRSEVSAGKPLLGICLGMQLLFEHSLEFGKHQGLGLLKGHVDPLKDRLTADLKIPQIGWNALHMTRSSPLFEGINEGDHVYFVHSYYATDCEDSLLATTEYSFPVTAAVGRGNIFGCQFHPEKSGDVGLRILKNFCLTTL